MLKVGHIDKNNKATIAIRKRVLPYCLRWPVFEIFIAISSPFQTVNLSPLKVFFGPGYFATGLVNFGPSFLSAVRHLAILKVPPSLLPLPISQVLSNIIFFPVM